MLVIGLALTACSTPSNAPTEFNDQVQTNFVDTCTGNWEGSGTTLASSETCQCAYTVVTGHYQGADGFTQFSELDNQLRSDPNAMPQDLKDELSSCPGWAGGGSPSGESQGGESQAGSTTSLPASAPTAPTGSAGTQAP